MRRPAAGLVRLLPRPEWFVSPLRGAQVTARIGRWLGIAFGVAFVTGVFSHFMQESIPTWLPSRPVWLYRVTQGVHVAAGTAAIPLLLVKLWSVYPKLFKRVEMRRVGPALVSAVERASIAVLVAAALFQLATGIANAAQWYPWSFSFRDAHYAVAWVAIGSVLLHVAVKLPVVRSALGAAPEDAEPVTGSTAEPAGAPVSRRTLLAATWTAAGLAVLTTAGAAVPWMRRVSVFAVTTGDGPQGLPVNRTASSAGVLPAALDPGWVLTVVNGAREVRLSRQDLLALPQRVEVLPIACVEGWSASATWTGVRVADVLALVGAVPASDLLVSSLQDGKQDRLPPQWSADPLSLFALRLNGEELGLDHGYPCRLIAPNRPGVEQTKWLSRVEVQA